MATKKDERSELQRLSGKEAQTPDTERAKREVQESYSKPGEAESYSEKGFVKRSEGNKLSYNPLSIDEFPQSSPEEERAFEIDIDKGVAQRLKEARAIGPSVRQQTQAEILNLVLLGREIGANPFSVRRLSFSIMRDMMMDSALAFALYYIETPLINASYSFDCEDAQLAAAVDAAFRPINSDFKSKTCISLGMGYQPMVKRFKLGRLDGIYRDKTSESPEKDLDVWPSKNIDALLWKTFLALPPENCLPRWNEMGNFDGFMYSPVPIPNPMMLGVAQTYGPQILSGYPIPLEWSIWKVNERNRHFGCQPPDEKVLLSNGKYIPIGALDSKLHKIASYDDKQSRIKGHTGRRPSYDGFEFEKEERFYSGNLIKIKTNNRSIRVTPNHKFTVKWNKDADKTWVVYLMKRGGWWRIGTSRPFYPRGKSVARGGINERSSREKADKTWIIGVFDSKQQALFYESLWSFIYNVPEWTFEASGSIPNRKEQNDYLHIQWSLIDSETGGKNLLSNKGLYEDYPLIQSGNDEIKPLYTNRWTIYGANLLPELMEIPTYVDGNKESKWSKFDVTSEHYEGQVVSLEVKPFHHYITNGIITQNSLYGSPRTQRAYRFWWSFWYRWALADRSFENKADPTKIIYYPTQVAEALDVNNPEAETPQSLQQKAIQAGNNIRSGSTVAFPGDFMVNEEGKTMNQRQWEAKYLEGGENFSSLEQNFMALQTMKLQAMFLPEQAFVDATMAGQTSSQRYISAQMGEIYQESQQLLSNEDDEIVNKYLIPEFVAANFPSKVGIPCKKVTRGYGSQNSELVKQIITLLGQKNPENIPVDIRELLRQQGIPLNSEAQQKLQEDKKKEAEENSKPPVMAPSKKEGIAGYNAGVEKTETGEHVYFQTGDEIFLSSSDSFISSLPKIPPYEDVAVKSAAMQMRKLFMDRYRNQITSLASQIRNKTILKLAEPESAQPSKPGLGAGAARIAAAGAVAAWLSDQAKSQPAVSARLKEILGRIVSAAGRRELKLANLDSNVFSPETQQDWVNKYAEDNLSLMDHTTQDVFKDFLEKQLQSNSHPDIVAQELEDNFADMPITYAARAVRAQTRDAYNKGMLQAGIDAGIDQVIAHDASDGTNLNTDKKCILRNGKVFSIINALKETEHPNGSLHWSYLTTSNLSVKITDEIPESLELSGNMQAGYDSEKEILYIRSSAKEGENRYMLALSEKLRF